VADPGFTNGSAKDEAPRRSSAVGARMLPKKFFSDFDSQNGDFRCILGTIFTIQLFGLNAKASSLG